jgi:hypothetical protein
MKRTSLIRRRRYLLGFALASLAVAALLPQAALARPDETPGASVDPYATSSITAEDVHGLSAGTGYVLPAADQAALDQATAGTGSILRADDFAPPRNVVVSSGSTASSVNWGQVSFFSVLGAMALAGVLLLGLMSTRRGTRVAHS